MIHRSEEVIPTWCGCKIWNGPGIRGVCSQLCRHFIAIYKKLMTSHPPQSMAINIALEDFTNEDVPGPVG